MSALLRGFADRLEGTPDLARAVSRLRESLPRTIDPAFMRPHADTYGRYVLHRDPEGLFSIVSLALAPGQSTAIHDHTTWGVVAVVQGCEREVRYETRGDGSLRQLSASMNGVGALCVVDPPNDLHRIEGACPRGGVTVSLHIYGGNADDVLGDCYERISLLLPPPPREVMPMARALRL